MFSIHFGFDLVDNLNIPGMASVDDPIMLSKDAAIGLFLSCPNTLQNQLLAEIITKKTSFPTTCGLNFGQTKDCDLVKNCHLVLIDCQSLDIDQIWSSLAMNTITQGNSIMVAFFNVRRDLEEALESVALGRGIRGLFFEDQPVDMLFKGIQVMINGELWFRHKAIARFIKSTFAANQTNIDPTVALTHREQEILSLLGSGHSNHQIAESLFISIHTVKTHIYNLFKKINVPNRLQAVLWAAQHLSRL